MAHCQVLLLALVLAFAIASSVQSEPLAIGTLMEDLKVMEAPVTAGDTIHITGKLVRISNPASFCGRLALISSSVVHLMAPTTMPSSAGKECRQHMLIADDSQRMLCAAVHQRRQQRDEHYPGAVPDCHLRRL